MKLSALLPALSALRQYLEQGVTYAHTLRGHGQQIDPDVIALYLTARMQTWNPTISGVHVLDPPTRQAAARFLGGVSANFVSAADRATRPRHRASTRRSSA